MSDDKIFQSTGTSQTFLAGAFIVALIALALSIYSISRTTVAVSALLDLQSAAVTSNGPAMAPASEVDALSKDLAALAARVRSIEEAAATAAASGQ